MNAALLALVAAIVQDAKLAAASAENYVKETRALNEELARKPGAMSEADLAPKMTSKADGALKVLLNLAPSPPVADALVTVGEAALDVDRPSDFEKVRERLEKTAPEQASKLGSALSSKRFVLRGIGVDRAYLEKFAAMLDAALAAYDETFGFAEWSKVPGKKLRVRVHLEKKIEKPPHFAPEFPFHSEIDFPVVDAKGFSSPTGDGKFLLYGLCHELGHVIAMWGDAKREEDHHAWAHYTGVVITEQLSKVEKKPEFLAKAQDARWRSLTAERKDLAAKTPSLKDRDGVFALLVALHDAVGPRAIGAAINFLDKDERPRVNRVRYYSFADLKRALLATLKDAKQQEAVKKFLG